MAKEKPRNKRGELVSDLWKTPNKEFNLLHSIYEFQIDAAAGPENTKLGNWFGPGSPLGIGNALDPHLNWSKYGQRFFVNPPYSTEGGPLSLWIETFHRQAEVNNVLIVAVLPERRNVKWYHEHIKGHATVFEPDYRYAFEPPKEEESTGPGARQGTMIVQWSGQLALKGSWA